jgi:hypothetical protein
MQPDSQIPDDSPIEILMPDISTPLLPDESPPNAIANRSYVVSCPSRFRDQVLALCTKKQCPPGDLARSMVLLLPSAEIQAFRDPGEPLIGDRELVKIKSGSQKGRTIKRKPRLQLRLNPGFHIAFIRKALAMALSIHGRALVLELRPGHTAPPADRIRKLEDETATLRKVIERISFMPLPHGVSTEAEARYVLGFTPGEEPDSEEVRRRFKILAQAFHPDRSWGCKARMMQVIDARKVMERLA